jgi:hypothetical protein
MFRGASAEQRESQPNGGAAPTQFHVDINSQTVLQTMLAGDNERQAKEAA